MDDERLLKRLDSLETIIRDLQAVVIDTNIKFEKLLKIENYCATRYQAVDQQVDHLDDDEQQEDDSWFSLCPCFP
jgi:exonuclease VII small subunit